LILDDWGLAPLTSRRDLLEIVDDRHRRGSTIVTSQPPVDHWHARLALDGETLRKAPHPAHAPGHWPQV
jgi:hypothetical protein